MGKHLTVHLLATKKHIITAITRPASTNQLRESLIVVRIDYASEDASDIDALVDALHNQQVLLITMSHHALAATTNPVLAAAKVGVPYVLPSWFGHDAANEAVIKDSMMMGFLDNAKVIGRLGVSFDFLLVCNFWYEFSPGGGPQRYGFDFKERSLTLYDGGKIAINTSTWLRCGRAISKLLSLNELPEDENDISPAISQSCNIYVYISSFRVS